MFQRKVYKDTKRQSLATLVFPVAERLAEYGRCPRSPGLFVHAGGLGQTERTNGYLPIRPTDQHGNKWQSNGAQTGAGKAQASEGHRRRL